MKKMLSLLLLLSLVALPAARASDADQPIIRSFTGGTFAYTNVFYRQDLGSVFVTLAAPAAATCTVHLVNGGVSNNIYTGGSSSFETGAFISSGGLVTFDVGDKIVVTITDTNTCHVTINPRKP